MPTFFINLVLMPSSSFGVDKEQIYKISLDCKDDATSSVYNVINKINKEEETTIFFQKGIYHFYPE